MNEKIKEKLIFIAIGCVGVVGMEIAMLIANYIIEGPSEELLDHFFTMLFVFFESTIGGSICYKIFKKKDIQNIRVEQRKKIISSQLYIITSLMIVVGMLFIIFIIKNVKVGIFFSGAFIFALCFWEIGCILANKMIQKDVEEINQKLREKNSK